MRVLNSLLSYYVAFLRFALIAGEDARAPSFSGPLRMTRVFLRIRASMRCMADRECRPYKIHALHNYSIRTLSLAPRPNVSGAYISSAFVGGTMNIPSVVARAK